MKTFDPTSYGPVFAGLLSERRLQPLGPGSPNPSARPLLKQLTVEAAFAHMAVKDRGQAACCLAAIWLYHDCLDESHRISQEIATPAGSWWHGILHRREPDYSNAKYWFRRAGWHPVFAPLGRAAAELARASTDPAVAFLARQNDWDPFAFVDLCELCAASESPASLVCRQVQQQEWELLFDFCCRAAGESA